MWTELRARVVDAVRGVDPFVLFGAGLLAVVVLFGALTLVIVGGTDGLDDLGLGLPGSRGSGPSAEGDPADGGATGGQGDGLTDGLAARETERRSTTTSAAPTGASGDESSAAASPTEQPAGGASSGP
ncbi:MAG TPA: hypothetical protein VJM49_18780, partial [Acidimicrobiales bacterium]|nr:hypothetical protein [Acidimicrobiales bacterium]